jgi:radical SAM protein with 4Fe4S-binding SPASM domain
MISSNKVFCIAPWVHMNLIPNGDVNACCISNYKYGSINDNSITEIWNSKEIKKLRLNMLRGVPNKNCTTCYLNEKCDNNSSRIHINNLYSDHMKYLKETKSDGTFDRFNLIYWDFRFNNICNFKCRMCGPKFSSSWETEKFGSINSNYKFNITLLEELDPLFNIVEDIYFAGGEPLLNDEHYYILNKLIELNKTNLNIYYNTNFSTLKYKNFDVLKLWSNFSNLVISISLDGSESRGELIRSGFKWKKFLYNVDAYKENFPEKKILIDCTYQLLNSFHIFDLHKKLFDLSIITHVDDFNFEFLKEPVYLSLWILPDNMKERLILKIDKHINEFLIPNNSILCKQKFENVKKFILMYNKSELIPIFKKYMNSLDIIRNENSIEIFPELSELWQ